RMLLARRFSSSLLPLLRTGTFDLSPHLGFLTNAEWPTAPRHLKICAADLGSGARLVFDGSTDVRLSQAVAASCAVPSVMSPVNAAGRLCVDGAIISPTNADLLIDEKAAPDLALVISPMSGRQARTMAGAMSARFAARRLAGELRRFRSGQRIIVVEPASRLSELVLDEALSSSRSRHILSSAFVGASA
ncbi:MAG TPA: patatin-like phospholipase family protein, partial [Ilumatobacteraceae bacterium]